MSTFVVTRKSDGQEVTRYAAMQPVEQLNDLVVPFADFDHVEFVEGVQPQPINPAKGHAVDATAILDLEPTASEVWNG